MKTIKRILKVVLYPLLPIWYLVKDSFPTDQPINIIKTLYVNFRALPIRQAIHLPIFIYRGVKIYKLGNIKITTSNVKRGMISIGRQYMTAYCNGRFFNTGTIYFNGPVQLGNGFSLDNSGVMILHGFNRLGPGITFIIRDKLEIGKFTTLGFRCFCMDSDDHYTINCNTLQISRNTKPIILGSRNWIANTTYIKKGTITPDYTIVASSNSLLSKDYSALESYSVLGGVPAKKIGSGIRRIYNWEEHFKLWQFFQDNPNIDIYCPNINQEDIDEYCTSNPLN